MTIEDIARKIENPALCLTEEVGEIETLIQKYPYAQTFPLLLLHSLGKSKDLRFEEALAQHAFKISDRRHLYFLINENESIFVGAEEILVDEEVVEQLIEQPLERTENLLVEEKNSKPLATETPVHPLVPETEAEPNLEIVEDNLKEIAVETEMPTEEPAEEVIAERKEIDISSSASLDEFDFVQVQEMNFEPVSIHIEEDDPFVESIEGETTIDPRYEPEPVPMPEGVENSIDEEHEPTVESLGNLTDTEVESEIETKPIEESTEEIIELTVDHNIGAEPEPIPTHESEGNITDAETENFEAQPMAFFDPTKEILNPENVEEYDHIEPSTFAKESKAIEFDSIEKKEDLAEDELTSNAISEGFHIRLEKEENVQAVEDTTQVFEEKIAAEKRSFMDWLKSTAVTNSIEYQVKQQRIEGIVDKFIEEEPKITRISKSDIPEKKSAEFFKVSKIAKASISEKAIPASETLAKIFAAQGNYSKAIDLYEQLMLLNPEKKSFFANQIKKLKKNK